jgi:DNA-binding phage protein
MKIQKPKRDTLSWRQSLVWDALNNSEATGSEIARRSGVSTTTLDNCIRGTYEPDRLTFVKILNAINELDTEYNMAIKRHIENMERSKSL